MYGTRTSRRVEKRLHARIASFEEGKRTGTKIGQTLRKPGSQNRKK